MTKLDNLKLIQELDKSNMLESVNSLAEQIEHAWISVKKVSVPKKFQKVNQIIISGMGGSSLGGHVIQSLFGTLLKTPVILRRDYNLPNWVDKNTLVLLSSYSGNTEEVISCAEEAVKKDLKALAITSNGKLARIAEENKIPCYQIEPKFNPCGQPRMAIGYSVFGQVALLAKAGLITVKDEQINRLKKYLDIVKKKYWQNTEMEDNVAKKTAEKLQGKIINLVAAQHLRGAIHVWNNQTNENAKNFSNYFYIPELNHHLMEGLKHPEANKKDLVFVFVSSKHYSKRIQQRFELTKDVVEKNKIAVLQIDLQGKNKLEDAFQLIQLGSYISFYLSMLNNLNPAPIPWVDYFKSKLK